MGFIDKFLDAIKLNDDDFDEDSFLDDDFDDGLDEDKPRKRFFDRFARPDEEEDDTPSGDEMPRGMSVRETDSFSDKSVSAKPEPLREERLARRENRPAKRAKVTPMRKKSGNPMEVNVIRPTSMEDAQDIADTLLDECTVILNLEGIDIDTAQRIIDFTCGACYSLEGTLKRVSNYIYILTPQNVDISGDAESLLSGAFDLPSMRSRY